MLTTARASIIQCAPVFGKTIAAVDVFLVATALLIFGTGLYDLFISRDDATENPSKPARVLRLNLFRYLKP